MDDPFDIRIISQTTNQSNSVKKTLSVQDISMKNTHLKIVNNSFFPVNNETFFFAGEMKNF